MTVVLVVCAAWVAVWLVARAFRYRPSAPALPTAPARRRVRADVPHALYYYMHARRPGRRYIGISNDPAVRHRRHARESWWFLTSTKTMVVVRWYPNLAAARQAETTAIRDACRRREDIANTQHVPAHYRAAARHH